MFFPVRTDRALQKTPWVNYFLIAVNVLVFILTHGPGGSRWMDLFTLDPQWPGLVLGFPYQYLTYQFIHFDGMHLLGNMVFLYVFGNSVEDRLGKAGYLAFFLTGGVLAGVGHGLLEPSRVMGASGAVCAVTGAYLALFPLTDVTIVYWFIFIGTFQVSSFYLILFQMAQDIFMQLTGGRGVAYMAHLAGYTYGFVMAMGLLGGRVLARESYDLFSLWEHRRRRAKFRALTQEGYQPWQAGEPARKQGREDANEVTPLQREIMQMRSRISQHIQGHELPTAAKLYRQLIAKDEQQALSRQEQLDIANQIASEGGHDEAARAYELFLKFYPGHPQIEQVELILGLIYTRYLNRPERARELLSKSQLRLTDPMQRVLVEQLLAELR